jgi:hypothetical protein
MKCDFCGEVSPIYTVILNGKTGEIQIKCRVCRFKMYEGEVVLFKGAGWARDGYGKMTDGN